jgi:hypothetical protein
MYIGNWNGLGKAMSVINNPDVKGVGCGFCPKCFQFPKIGAGNPPCMPNYALGADLPCGRYRVRVWVPIAIGRVWMSWWCIQIRLLVN